ncbi:MAG: copper-binding protein [Polyangiales bacterium]
MILRRMPSTLVLGLALAAAGAVTARGPAAQAQQAAVYATRGVIRAVADDRRSVRIAHEAIPGFMNAMTMTFTARNAAQLQGLGPADRVTLRFTATPDGQLLLDAITRLP